MNKLRIFHAHYESQNDCEVGCRMEARMEISVAHCGAMKDECIYVMALFAKFKRRCGA